MPASYAASGVLAANAHPQSARPCSGQAGDKIHRGIRLRVGHARPRSITPARMVAHVSITCDAVSRPDERPNRSCATDGWFGWPLPDSGRGREKHRPGRLLRLIRAAALFRDRHRRLLQTVAWPIGCCDTACCGTAVGNCGGCSRKLRGPCWGRLIHRLLRGFRLIPLLLGRLRHRALLPF